APRPPGGRGGPAAGGRVDRAGGRFGGRGAGRRFAVPAVTAVSVLPIAVIVAAVMPSPFPGLMSWTGVIPEPGGRAIRRESVSSAAMTPPVEWGGGILPTFLAGGGAAPDWYRRGGGGGSPGGQECPAGGLGHLISLAVNSPAPDQAAPPARPVPPVGISVATPPPEHRVPAPRRGAFVLVFCSEGSSHGTVPVA